MSDPYKPLQSFFIYDTTNGKINIVRGAYYSNCMFSKICFSNRRAAEGAISGLCSVNKKRYKIEKCYTKHNDFDIYINKDCTVPLFISPNNLFYFDSEY